jgi:GH15 family glucan-1,4-alpha-glucosidase
MYVPSIAGDDARLTMPRRTAPISAPSAQLPQSPIEDYAVVGDCRTAALISRDGAIDWLCLPNYASPSVFAHILSPGRGGRFSIQPREAFVSRRKYRDLSPVLETTFETRSGSARLTDLLPVIDGAQSLEPMREIMSRADHSLNSHSKSNYRMFGQAR